LRTLGGVAVPYHRQALDHPDPLVREQAAVTLGLMPDVGPQALATLADRLGDGDERVCLAVTEALELHEDLGFLPDWKRLVPVVGRVYSTAGLRLRAALLRLLSSAGREASPLMQQFLAIVLDGREELRLPVVQVLEATGSDAVAALPLLERLNRHSTGPLRTAVEDAISALNGR